MPPRKGRARSPRSESSELRLPEKLGESLAAGHPWVYRNHVPAGFSAPSGTWVRIRAAGFTGYALWDASSPIALRVFAREARPDAAWFRSRVEEALALRAALRSGGTTAFRLLFGEGDGVPGLTIDVYDRYAVVLTYADSIDAIVPDVVSAVRACLPLEGIVRRAGRGSAEERLSVLWGSEPPERLVVNEHGVQLLAELRSGQKSGLFLDHRENRACIRAHTAGASVLNLFSYTGAFSVYAALGGATRVTSVDVASGAMNAARQNFTLNAIDPGLHEFRVADAFDFLTLAAETREAYDIVISDPPSFAGSREQLFRAERAYTRLHALGLSVVGAGGLYAAASCTAQVSPEAFRRILASAAERARVRFQIVHDIGQPSDHPVLAGHPEGRYLKFVVGRVLPRA